MKLLSLRGNHKIDKSPKEYLVANLSFAPAKLSGYNVCPKSTPGCRHDCINLAGLGVYSSVQEARIAKTKFFMEDRQAFKKQLYTELLYLLVQAHKKGRLPACRLNTFSDIQWEKMFPDIFNLPIQFYDYSKIPNRMGKTPPNYHLTFSRSESNDNDAIRLLNDGFNVAYVFNELPKTYLGFKVHDGDKHDLRFLDPHGIIGLKAKGRARKDTTSGFVLYQISNKGK